MSESPRPPSTVKKSRGLRWLLWAPVCLLAAVVAAFFVNQALASGHVARGVVMGGIRLGGLTRGEAANLVLARKNELASTVFVLTAEQTNLEVTPEAVGFTLDVDASVASALSVGRDQGLVDAFQTFIAGLGHDLPIPLSGQVDESKIQALADDWEKQAIADGPFEGCVKVEGGQVGPDYPRPGRGLDRAALRDIVLGAALAWPRAPTPLPIVTTAPKRPKEAVDRAVARARALTSRPLTLTLPPPDAPPAPLPTKTKKSKKKVVAVRLTVSDDGARLVPLPEDPEAPEGQPAPASVTWSVDDLVLALRSDPTPTDDGSPSVTWDRDALMRNLVGIAPFVEHPPKRAGFLLEDDKITVIPSSDGNRLDPAAVEAALIEASKAPSATAMLPLVEGELPGFSTEDAERLGLRKRVSTYTTYHRCCEARVKNIHRIADLLDGMLVAPSATFSVNNVVGPRTSQGGFFPAPTIEEGEMVNTVGGGVSQFATTMFNAIFWGGYDVVERQPHSYWFSRYPMGRDATLSYPKPDLAFRNDTTSAVLIDTSYTETSVTVTFYGDDGGRKVEGEVSSKRDITPPPIQYFGNPTYRVDRVKTKDSGMVGWSVWVTRTIIAADGTKKEERRKVTYKPRPKKVQVHPCKVPKGHEGYTGEPCPKEEEEDAGAPTSDEPEKEEEEVTVDE